MSEVVQIAPVGRVSPQGVTRQVHRNGIDANKPPHEDVGLRCANPTYGATGSATGKAAVLLKRKGGRSSGHWVSAQKMNDGDAS